MVQKRKVDEMARTSGKSVGRLVREGLGLQLRDIGKAYQHGYEKGCEETRQKYLVRVPCSCGRLFPVVGEDRIREVEDILMANCSWYHEDCRPEEVAGDDCRLFKNHPKKGGKAAKR